MISPRERANDRERQTDIAFGRSKSKENTMAKSWTFALLTLTYRMSKSNVTAAFFRPFLKSIDGYFFKYIENHYGSFVKSPMPRHYRFHCHFYMFKIVERMLFFKWYHTKGEKWMASMRNMLTKEEKKKKRTHWTLSKEWASEWESEGRKKKHQHRTKIEKRWWKWPERMKKNSPATDGGRYNESKTFDLITLSREIHLFCAFVRINLFIWKDGRSVGRFCCSMLNTHRTKKRRNTLHTNKAHMHASLTSHIRKQLETINENAPIIFK